MNLSREPLYTIVLAAGEGTRLRPLTRALHGSDLPKQFATLTGRRSMLAAAVERALGWSEPEHVVVVVARGYEPLAASQLRAYPGLDIVEQPANLGTAPGILLPLSRIVARDRAARVVVLPSDQYVAGEAIFARAIRAADAVAAESRSVVLLGAVPDKAEDQYGWIVPRRNPVTGRWSVAAFREKPTTQVAAELRAAGALWSTFVMSAAAATLWSAVQTALPSLARRFRRYVAAVGTSEEQDVLDGIYRELVPADFSRDVLERAQDLGVVALPACGWSDWGTPGRVFESLRGTPELDELVTRLGRHAATFPELRLETTPRRVA